MIAANRAATIAAFLALYTLVSGVGAVRVAKGDELSDRLDTLQASLDVLEADAAERALERAIDRDRRAAARHEATEPEWKPAPGAQPRTVSAAFGNPARPAAASSGTPAERRAVIEFLDADSELTGKWRQVNKDPQFLAWLAQPDPVMGRERRTMLMEAFNAGDAERTAAFFRAFLEGGVSGGVTYAYIPTAQDRAEIHACVSAAGPDTSATDCVMPTLNRVTSTMLAETGGTTWPAHPSQMTVMMQAAGAKCGMSSGPTAPVSPQAKPCLHKESRKIAKAVVVALRDDLLAEAASQRPAVPPLRPSPSAHTPELMRQATDYSSGYAYGESIGKKANCSRAVGDWHRGCLAGSYEREKFDPPEGCLARAASNPDPSLAAAARAMCVTAPAQPARRVSAADNTQAWLRAYDQAVTVKAGGVYCGNGVSPDNDGCRAGAAAWLQAEGGR